MKLRVMTFESKLSDNSNIIIKAIPYNTGWIVFHSDGKVWNMTSREFDAHILDNFFTLKCTQEV